MADLPDIMSNRYNLYAGFLYQSQPIKTFDHPSEEREVFFQKLWDMGGFRMLANNYSDMLADRKANQEAYEFWVKHARANIRSCQAGPYCTSGPSTSLWLEKNELGTGLLRTDGQASRGDCEHTEQPC